MSFNFNGKVANYGTHLGDLEAFDLWLCHQAQVFAGEKKEWVTSCHNTSITSEWTAACCLTNSSASSSEWVASLLLYAILEKNEVICCGHRNSFTVKIRFPLWSLKHLISFRDVIWVCFNPCGLAMFNLFLQVPPLLEIKAMAWHGGLQTSPSLWQTRGTTVYFCIQYLHFKMAPFSLKTLCVTDLSSVNTWETLSPMELVFTVHEVLLQPSIRHVGLWCIRHLGMETGDYQWGCHLLVGSFQC